jgi:hypothetical protein
MILVSGRSLPDASRLARDLYHAVARSALPLGWCGEAKADIVINCTPVVHGRLGGEPASAGGDLRSDCTVLDLVYARLRPSCWAGKGGGQQGDRRPRGARPCRAQGRWRYVSEDLRR